MFRKKKISLLIVEDESVLRGLLAKKLRKEGYVVTEADNGQNGLEAALKGHPDLILLDIIMPRMNGVVLLKELRGDEWGQTANVMLLTNLSDAEGIEEARQYCVMDYLVKSDWSLEELSRKIKAKLAASKP